MNSEQRTCILDRLGKAERLLSEAANLMRETGDDLQALLFRPWAHALRCYHEQGMPDNFELLELYAWEFRLGGNGADSVLRVELEKDRQPKFPPKAFELGQKMAFTGSADALWEVADALSMLPDHHDFRQHISMMIALSQSVKKYAEAKPYATFTFPTPKYWTVTLHGHSPRNVMKSIKYAAIDR